MKKETPFIPNSTQNPNVFFDWIFPFLTKGELKCLLYIIRRTYGFRKKKDPISLSQFVSGIVTKAGKRLDCGAGVSRPCAVESLKNLSGAGIIITTKEKNINWFEINDELLGDKYVHNKVVKKINQLRILTKSSKESLPKQVKLFNLQYKGKKGKKVFIKNLKKEKEFKKEFSLKDIKEKRKKLSKKLTFAKV